MPGLDDSRADDLAEGGPALPVAAQGEPSTSPGSPAAERSRMRVATLLFAAATLLSRFAGLAREIVTAAVFGASTTYSAFVIANQIPNLLRSLVADSALSAAFVPVFTRLREGGEQERAWRVASAVCAVIVAVLGPLTVLAMVLAPNIVTPFVSSTFTDQQVELTIGLARVLMPIVLILALSGVVVGLLNAHDRFGAAALAPVAWNAVILLSLVGAWWLAAPDDRIWVYAAGTVAGTLVQAVLPAPWLRGLGGRLTPLRASWRDPKVREVFVLMLPVTCALGLINVQQLIGSLYAAKVDANVGLLVAGRDLFSGLDAGAGPSLIDKAFRIYMLPQGIFSVAVSTVVFPVLSRMAARADEPGFADAVATGLRQILVLLVPSSVFLGVLCVPVTQVLYERGAFGPAETLATAAVLAALAVGLTFNGLALLLTRACFARQATWMPAVVAVATLALNVVLVIASYRSLGVVGIAGATSVANVLGVVLLYRMLAARTAPLGTARTLVVALGTLVAALVAVGLAAAAFAGWRALAGDGALATVAGVAAALAVAAAVYLELGARLGVVPRGLVRGLIQRRRPT